MKTLLAILSVLSATGFFIDASAKDFLDYRDFDPFQRAISYENALKRFNNIFADAVEYRDSQPLFDLNRESLAIFSSAAMKAQHNPEYVYYFGNANPTIRARTYARTAAAKPLAGLRIALDPGHLGGALASREGRRTYNRELGIDFNEGDLALYTAKRIRNLLQPLGAEVMLTREESGKGALPLSYEEWKKDPAVVRAAVEDVVRASTYQNQTAAELESSKYWSDARIFFDAYLRVDRLARAQKINDFRPHFSFIIHYNASGAEPFTTKLNQNLAFIPGGFTAYRMNYVNARQALLRLLISDEMEKSQGLCEILVRKLNEKTGLGPVRRGVFDAEESPQEYLISSLNYQPEQFEINPLLEDISYPFKFGREVSRAVFSRNLDISTFALGASCYGESLFQDNLEEARRLNRRDFIVDGVATSKRVDDVSRAYAETVLEQLGLDPQLLNSI